MTERQTATPIWPGSTPPGIEEAKDDSTVSLKPWWDLLQAYRLVIVAVMAVLVLMTTAALLAAALMLPTERTASLKIRMLFDGAAEGRYPNGSTFSPSELMATPVLAEVFRINDLQRFGTYDGFRDSVSVLQSSIERDMLAASYSSRLADSKLTSVDRARLEDEYRKKRDAIKDPVYELSLRRSERLAGMPPSLAEKVLNDTVAVWARQADELKGATHFNIPVFSRSVLTPDILNRDFLMVADDLRIQAQRAAEVADQLMLVPGATTIRTEKDFVSLAEVRFAIRDVLRNRVEPAVYLIHERGLTNDRQAMVQYLHGHSVETRLERDATRARLQALQDALQSYIGSKGTRMKETPQTTGTTRGNTGAETQTLIPQIGDSFLDRLIEMSSQSQVSDVQYRQKLTDRIIKEGEVLAELERSVAYYEGLERTVRVNAAPTLPRDVDAVKAELKFAFDSVCTSVDRLVMIYNVLSAQRLNPNAKLYSVTEPFSVRTRRAVSWNSAAISLSLTLLLGAFLAPIGCAVHQFSRRRTRR